MTLRYDTVIFDLDGTLLDTSDGILRSIRYAVKELGLPLPGAEVLRTFIGPPIQKSMQRTFGLTPEAANAAAEIFRNRYKDHDFLYATPYPGITELLKKLRAEGLKTAVATYKRQDYAGKVLEAFGMEALMDVICGADLAGLYSKSDIIDHAVRETLSTDRTRIIMVGDSDNDLIGAKEAGLRFAGVTWGFGFRSEKDIIDLSGDIAVNTMDALEKVLTERL